jgi:hypothetical protein
MLTRRYFLAASTGSLVSSGLPFTALAGMPSNTPISADSDPRLNAQCDVFAAGQLVAQMNLVALEEPFIAESRVAQYILNFEAAESVLLPEASYQVSHPTLGKLDLFLQPCGEFNHDQHNGIHYRACMGILR